MAVHLTRIYTKTGDAGTTRLGNNEQVAEDRSADRRVRRRRRVQRRDRRGAGARATSPTTSARCSPRCRTTCSTWAPTCATRSRRTRSTRRCGSPRTTSTRLEGWCDEFNARLSKLDSFILPGGTAGRGAAARGAHGRPARRTLGVGADRRPTRSGPARCRQSTSTGSPTCCSSWPGSANPDGDVKWVPGGGEPKLTTVERGCPNWPLEADPGRRARDRLGRTAWHRGRTWRRSRPGVVTSPPAGMPTARITGSSRERRRAGAGPQ